WDRRRGSRPSAVRLAPSPFGRCRPLYLVGQYCRHLVVAAVPSAALLPLPSEFDALPTRQAADIECGDVNAETAGVGRLVYGIAPVAVTPMNSGGPRQRNGKPGAGMKFQDWRMRPPERISGSRSTALIPPPYRARPVYRVPETARDH